MYIYIYIYTTKNVFLTKKMRLDSLIILRVEWNSHVFVLRGKPWKYWRIKLYNLCCVLCLVCCVLCLVRPSVVVVIRPSVPSVRRRRPSSSSSVRPSVPSVRRRRSVRRRSVRRRSVRRRSVRRRRPSSVVVVVRRRPSVVRPSSVVVITNLQIQGRMQIFKKNVEIEVGSMKFG